MKKVAAWGKWVESVIFGLAVVVMVGFIGMMLWAVLGELMK